MAITLGTRPDVDLAPAPIGNGGLEEVFGPVASDPGLVQREIGRTIKPVTGGNYSGVIAAFDDDDEEDDEEGDDNEDGDEDAEEEDEDDNRTGWSD